MVVLEQGPILFFFKEWVVSDELSKVKFGILNASRVILKECSNIYSILFERCTSSITSTQKVFGLDFE
jgi:hypothetical protein